jgi:hypothetical protein
VSIVESVAAVVTALGGFGGLAALVNAIKPQPPPTPGPKKPQKGAIQVASWPVGLGLGLGLVACLLAGGLVAVVGATSLALNRIQIVLLTWSVVVTAAFALTFSAHILWHAVKDRVAERILYASAGLLTGLGALAATLIAGTS